MKGLSRIFGIIIFISFNNIQLGLSIKCFECVSINHTNIHCEDPMSPAAAEVPYNDCQVPKENHVGTFPGNYCVKVFGTSARTDEFMMIRRCALEDMNSQCGRFKFANDTYVDGCILTCDQDGCNKGSLLGVNMLVLLFIAFLSVQAG